MRKASLQARIWLFSIPAVVISILYLIRLIFEVLSMTVENRAPMRKTAIGGMALCLLSLFGLILSPLAWVGVFLGFGAWLQALGETLYTSPEPRESPAALLVYDR